MNEFTKKELRELWYLTPANHYPSLKGKLKSLLDNYCESKSSCCSVHAGTSEECNDLENVHYTPSEECEHETSEKIWVNPITCAWFLDSDKHSSSLNSFIRCKKCGLLMNKFANE